MVAVAIRQEYGPTLGQLLSPRWRGASRLTQALAIACALALVALVGAAAVSLLNASYSHGGRVPFSFSYRSMQRVAPEGEEFVRVERDYGDGRLEDSFAVSPLLLPPYSGALSGELALYATGYIQALSRRATRFALRGEGKTKVNGLPAYDVFYSAEVQGHTMYGRNVLLVPERPGARAGVTIVMLTAPKANAQVTSSLLVATVGVLSRPFTTFTLN